MARLDKVHLETANGQITCNPGLIPARYERTENVNKVTCARCLGKRAQRLAREARRSPKAS